VSALDYTTNDDDDKLLVKDKGGREYSIEKKYIQLNPTETI